MNFGKYNPLSLFFPLGLVPECGFIGALISGGLGLLSSSKSAKASERAAATQAAAQDRAAELIYKQFQETKATLEPFVGMGLAGAQEQQDLLGLSGPEAQAAAQARFQESPGYKFRLQRGLGAVDQGFAGRNALVSGAREKARMEYGQGLASSEFANYFNRLGAQTGTGLAAAQAIGGVGSSAAQGQAQMTAAAGDTLAAGALGKARAYQSGIEGMIPGIEGAVGAFGNWMKNRKKTVGG